MYTRRGPVRVETRIRNRAAATDVIRRIADGEDIGAITAGILSRNLKFHVAGTRRKDRRPICEWWDTFLGSVEPIQLPRHRDKKHRSPWYVPPTTADRARKYIANLLHGDATDGPVVDVLRAVVADHDATVEIAAAFAPTPETGNGRYDYVSPISSSQSNLLDLLHSLNVSGDVISISSSRPFDISTFAPEIVF